MSRDEHADLAHLRLLLHLNQHELSHIHDEVAIEDGLAKATLAVPGLHWFEVGDISGYIEEGHAKSWHVTLRAGIDTK